MKHDATSCGQTYAANRLQQDRQLWQRTRTIIRTSISAITIILEIIGYNWHTWGIDHWSSNHTDLIELANHGSLPVKPVRLTAKPAQPCALFLRISNITSKLPMFHQADVGMKGTRQWTSLCFQLRVAHISWPKLSPGASNL